MAIKPNLKNHPNFYEHALLLADGQSRQCADRWASFIDNLSRVCDEFASHLSLKERHALAHCKEVTSRETAVQTEPICSTTGYSDDWRLYTGVF